MRHFYINSRPDLHNDNLGNPSLPSTHHLPGPMYLCYKSSLFKHNSEHLIKSQSCCLMLDYRGELGAEDQLRLSTPGCPTFAAPSMATVGSMGGFQRIMPMETLSGSTRTQIFKGLRHLSFVARDMWGIARFRKFIGPNSQHCRVKRTLMNTAEFGTVFSITQCMCGTVDFAIGFLCGKSYLLWSIVISSWSQRKLGRREC